MRIKTRLILAATLLAAALLAPAWYAAAHADNASAAPPTPTQPASAQLEELTVTGERTGTDG